MFAYPAPRVLLALSRLSRFPMSVYGKFLPLVEDFIEKSISQGWVQRDEERRAYTCVQPTPDLVESATAIASISLLNLDETSPDAEFLKRAWRVLLMRGVSVDRDLLGSGFVAPSGMKDAAIHILLCGLDVGLSTTPDIDTWSSFTSTYEKPREATGLTAVPHCACGRVRENVVLHYAIDGDDGVAKLLRMIADDAV